MYHSITFGDKNTWEDWHLVPSSRPLFNPPSVKTKIIDIPGGNGSLDLSDSLTKYPLYNNREGDIEFIVMNDYWEWYEAYSTIMNYLHGKTMIAILEDEPDYYYVGRFSVNSWKSQKDYSRITISYSVKPFKYFVGQSPVVIDIPMNPKTVTFTRDDYGNIPSRPEFSVTSEMYMRFVNNELGVNKTVKLIPEIVNSFDDLIFYGPIVQMTFSLTIVSSPLTDFTGNDILDYSGNQIMGVDTGNGSVTIDFEKGGL